jgi:hypothetical protein
MAHSKCTTCSGTGKCADCDGRGQEGPPIIPYAGPAAEAGNALPAKAADEQAASVGGLVLFGQHHFQNALILFEHRSEFF